MTDEDKALIWLTNQKNKKHVKTIINLIDKQQKEIEELKGIKNGTTIEYIGKATYWRKDKIEKYFISKDKIRELLKDIYYYYGQNNDMFLIDKIRRELLGE